MSGAPAALGDHHCFSARELHEVSGRNQRRGEGRDDGEGRGAAAPRVSDGGRVRLGVEVLEASAPRARGSVAEESAVEGEGLWDNAVAPWCRPNCPPLPASARRGCCWWETWSPTTTSTARRTG